ncbi:MAG: hypothetical protein ACLTWK_02725 [Eisenbergiella sp.]
MKSTDHKKIFRADTEQENKKQLNQSEKRKIIAVCAAVAAIAVIFSGVGIGYSVRRASEENSLSFSEMEDSVKGQMQEEMRSAAVYLEKLDESISGNREKLNEVNERLTQREQVLLESEKVQKQLEKNSSGMTERVTQLEKTTHTKVNEIQTDMESIHAEIQASLEQISKVIASLEEQKEQDGKDHDQSITEINRVNQSVQEINQSVENIENKLNSSYDGIKGLIEKLQAEETKNQEALKKDHQLLVQSLTDVEGNLKIILETDMTQISQAFSDLTASFQAKVDQLGSLLETRMDQMDANLGGLGEDISGLDQNISGLGTDISGLDQNISGLGTDINGLNQNISGLGQNISGLDQNISQNLGGVAEKLGELNLGVNNSLTLLEQNFAKHMNELSQISGEGTGALKTYLGELSEALKQDLNQVFTSVSNGKTGLASALLTKGVSAENDATFAELKDAVLRIPQKLVIGVEEVPGTITYHYHYHVDGAGENPHTETNPQQGGCYTVPKYHVHSEAAGCYTIRRYHKHNDSCPGHPVWVDWVPNQEPYWGWIYECNDQPINASEKVLNCSKSTSAIDCYNTSCGWVDGQITGAEIVYDKEAAKQRAEAAAKGEPPLAEEALPEESIEQEYPEGGLPFAPPEIADQLEPPKPEVETQPENETKPEDETLPESETKPEGETQTESEAEPEVETQPEGETEPESEMPSESGTEPESAAQPEGGTTPESEIPSESEAASESEAQPESEAEPESETHAEAA